MEVAVSAAVGALVCCCLWMLWGSFDDSERGLHDHASKDERPAVRAIRFLGNALPDRLVVKPWVKRLCEEAEHMGVVKRILGESSTANETVVLIAVFGIIGGVVLGALSASFVGVLMGAFAPAIVLGVLSAGRIKSDAKRVEEAMPEAFGALAMSLGSGHSLAQGMRFVGSHAEEPVKTEFMNVSYSVDCGISAADALDEMLERIKAPGLDLVTLALKVSQRTGAPLKDLLAEASSMVGDRIELRRRLDVKTSQARMSAHMVALMPVAMIGILMLLSPDFRHGLATAAGAVSIAIALVLNAVAWTVIKNIMEVEL